MHRREKGGRLGGPALWLALLLLLAYAYAIPRGALANADSHIALTRAIVDDHALRIDRYAAGLEDRSAYRGHFYTDKAPGLSLLAVPVYALLRLTLPRAFFAPDTFFMVRYLLTVLVVGLPAALFVGLLLFPFLASLIGRGRAALLACGYGLGTMAWALSALLFSHVVAAMALFGAFMLLHPVLGARRRPAPWRWAASGGLCGLAVTCEYPAALVAAGVALFAAYTAYRPCTSTGDAGPASARCVPAGSAGFQPATVAGARVDDGEHGSPEHMPAGSQRSRGGRAVVGCLRSRGIPGVMPRLALFGVAGLTALAPLAAYNVAVYGGPFSQGYAHLHGAREFVSGMGHGVEGVGLPNLAALWGITFSPYRGLFVLSPFLLLALPGLAVMWRRGRGQRASAALCAYAAGAMLLFDSGYYFWDGGVSLGPRHVAPALPFLLVPVAHALRRPAWRRLGRLLIALSIGVVALCCATVIIFLPGVPDPIATLALPHLLSGPTTNNWGMLLGLRGPASLLPFIAGEGALALALRRALRTPPTPYSKSKRWRVDAGRRRSVHCV